MLQFGIAEEHELSCQTICFAEGERRTGWLPGKAKSNHATLQFGTSLMEVSAPSYQSDRRLVD